MIDNVKINILVSNDFSNSETFVIDIEEKSATIENCEISIVLEIQSKEFYIKKQFMFNKIWLFNQTKNN